MNRPANTLIFKQRQKNLWRRQEKPAAAFKPQPKIEVLAAH
jgi:hypothetical protein